jgi:hypothetical protein
MKSRTILITATLLANIAAFTGCASQRPLRPGVASIKSSAPQNGAQFASELKQPENPSQSAAQNFERTIETELPLPAGTRVEEKVTVRDTQAPTAPPVVQERTIVLAQPVIQKTRTIEKAGTVIGAAQKDTARELSAKLSSLKGMVWVGVFLFLAGIASIAYPPLRVIVGSVTTSVAMIIGGLALIVLPTLIVGHELIILGAVALAVGNWFLAHRHGELKARVAKGQK